MEIHTTPNIQYVKGVRWLAYLYENMQAGSATAQTLNKLVDIETSHIRTQNVLADYEKHTACPRQSSSKNIIRVKLMDFVEWASLTKMTKHLRQNLEAVSVGENL